MEGEEHGGRLWVKFCSPSCIFHASVISLAFICYLLAFLCERYSLSGERYSLSGGEQTSKIPQAIDWLNRCKYSRKSPW